MHTVKLGQLVPRVFVKQVRKQQRYAVYALSGYRDLNFEVIDVSDPANEDERNKMSETCKPNARGVIQPPQFFNDDEYCGVSGLSRAGLDIFSSLTLYTFGLTGLPRFRVRDRER